MVKGQEVSTAQNMLSPNLGQVRQSINGRWERKENKMTGRTIGGKLAGKNTVSYKTGSYDSSSHAGHGTKQKLLWPAAGTDLEGPTPGATRGRTPVRDGIEGKGSAKRGYQTDAHSGLHHGKSGEAVGHLDDLHMNYDSPLHSEGKELNTNNPSHTKGGGHNRAESNSGPSKKGAGVSGSSSGHGKASGKADHHPRMGGPVSKFEQMTNGHGFGHESSGQRAGHLRLSGSSKAHQVGKR
jgi:hypothetical protein